MRGVELGEGGGGEVEEDRPGARHGRGEGEQGGQAAAPWGGRVGQEHNCEADEDYTRDRLQSGGVLAVPARGVQQHHPEPDGHHQGHGAAQDRLQGPCQSGKLEQLGPGSLESYLDLFIGTEMEGWVHLFSLPYMGQTVGW